MSGDTNVGGPLWEEIFLNGRTICGDRIKGVGSHPGDFHGGETLLLALIEGRSWVSPGGKRGKGGLCGWEHRGPSFLLFFLCFVAFWGGENNNR